jgi:hypothetical protein
VNSGQLRKIKELLGRLFFPALLVAWLVNLVLWVLDIEASEKVRETAMHIVLAWFALIAWVEHVARERAGEEAEERGDATPEDRSPIPSTDQGHRKITAAIIAATLAYFVYQWFGYPWAGLIVFLGVFRWLAKGTTWWRDLD